MKSHNTTELPVRCQCFPQTGSRAPAAFDYGNKATFRDDRKQQGSERISLAATHYQGGSFSIEPADKERLYETVVVFHRAGHR